MYKIVLADDESTMRKALLTLVDWAALDCEVLFAAEDGQAVLDSLAVCKPDIIISDIRMPRLDGLQLAEHLHTNYPEIKLILLTAFADFAYAQQAVRFRVSEYVVKSGALDKIVSAVQNCKAQLSQERAPLTLAPNATQRVKSAMDGSLCGAQELLQLDAELGLAASPAVCLVLQMPAGGLADAQAQQEVLRRAALLLTDTLGECVAWQFALSASAVCFVTRGATRTALGAKCRSAADTFFRLTGARIYIGMSLPCTGAHRLPHALAECRRALDESFYDAFKCVTAFEDKSHTSGTGAGARAALDAGASRGTGIHTCADLSAPLQMQAFCQNPSLLSALLTRLDGALRIGTVQQARAVLQELTALQKKSAAPSAQVLQESAQVLHLCDHCIAQAGETWESLMPGAESYSDKGNTGAQADTGISAVAHAKSVPADPKVRLAACSFFEEVQTLLTHTVSLTCRVTAAAAEKRSDIVAQVQAYLAQNYCNEITLGSIAATVGANPSYVSRVFKTRTGMSLVSTITQLRMQAAQELLRNPATRVQDVAEAVGMENATYFTHVFHKFTGMSPRAYQEQAAAHER